MMPTVRTRPRRSLDELEHLGGGARAGEGDDRVVAAVDEGLGCRERVGLAVPARLAEPGVGLGHEPRGAAADDGDARAGAGSSACSSRSAAARAQVSGCEASSAAMCAAGDGGGLQGHGCSR